MISLQEATIPDFVVHSTGLKQIYPQTDGLGQNSPQKSLPAFPDAFLDREGS